MKATIGSGKRITVRKQAKPVISDGFESRVGKVQWISFYGLGADIQFAFTRKGTVCVQRTVDLNRHTGRVPMFVIKPNELIIREDFVAMAKAVKQTGKKAR